MEFDQPTQDARRHAVANALAWAPGLVRYAARFTATIEDAEDAYQRAMEIALTKAPTVERKPFIAWLHTVVRHEALRIRGSRDREAPTADEDLDQQLLRDGSRQALGPDAVVEWRERYRSVQDGLTGLTENQRICLMMRTAGMPRPEIALATGLSARQIDRAICEGRDRLRQFELRLETGQECASVSTLMDLVIDGSAGQSERRRVDRHVKHCPACRAAYRTRTDQMRLIASLVPTGLIGSDLMSARPPEGVAIASWWDRVSGAATVRTGQAMQMWLDLPTVLASKAGARAIAVTAAGIVGTPFVVQAVRVDPALPPHQIEATAPTPTPPASVTTPIAPKPGTATTTTPSSHATSKQPSTRTTRPSAATVRTAPARTARAVTRTVRVSSPVRSAPRARVSGTSSAGSASAEFAP